MKRILVTGGAGMVGSNVVRHLLALEEMERVTVFDNFSSGRWEHLQPFINHPLLNVIEGDLADPHWFHQVPVPEEGMFDTVVHLVANPDISKAVTDPGIDFRQGTVLCQHVLELMRICEIGNLLYLSGSGVYGEAPTGLLPFSEDHGPCIPISTYAASKLACEAMIAAHCHMFGLRARVLRPANIVGPNQTHGVSCDFINQLLRHPSFLRILGDGQQSKSYIYVDDVIYALFRIEKIQFPSYRVWNIASCDAITVYQIARIACEEVGLNPEEVRFEYSGGTRGWQGDVPIVRLDCQRLASLGWCAHRGSSAAVREGMRDLYGKITNQTRPRS